MELDGLTELDGLKDRDDELDGLNELDGLKDDEGEPNTSNVPVDVNV